MSSIFDQLKKYREKLLNFTPRNRELFFKTTKGKSVNLSTLHKHFQKPEEDGKDPVPQPVPIKTASNSLMDIFKNSGFSVNQYLNRNGALPDLLEKKLKKLRLEDRKFQKEYGLSGAWLLGPFLCWRQRTKSDRFRPALTPLFKVPIDIETVKGDWKVVLESEELQINPTLQVALKNEWNIELPKYFNDQSEIKDALKQITEIIVATGKKVEFVSTDESELPPRPKLYETIEDDETGEKIRRPIAVEDSLEPHQIEFFDSITDEKFKILDVLYVDLINASSLSLYSDFEDVMQNAENHPILGELMSNDPPKNNELKAPSLGELDGVYKEADNKFVIPVDGSQHRAVAAAREPVSTVLIGPPGTGKSQTITNLIADSLAEGLRVLFVAEKRAALDVVFDRLNQAKIGDACLVMHGSDISYSDVYGEILENSKFNPPNAPNWESYSSQIDRLKTKLGQYREVLSQVHSTSKLNSAEIFALSARFREQDRSRKLFDLFGGLSFSKIEEIKAELQTLGPIAEKVPEIAANPWFDVKLDKSSLEVEDTFIPALSKMAELIDKASNSYDELQVISSKHKCSFEKFHAADVKKLTALVDEFSALQESKIVKELAEKDREELQKGLKRLRTELVVLKNTFESFSKVKRKDDINLMSELFEYFTVQAAWFSIFSSEYWKKKKQLKLVLGIHSKLKRDLQLRILEQAINFDKAWASANQHLEKLSINLDLQRSEYAELDELANEAEKIRNVLDSLDQVRADIGFEGTNDSFEKQQDFVSTLKAAVPLIDTIQKAKPAYEEAKGVAISFIEATGASKAKLDASDWSESLVQIRRFEDLKSSFETIKSLRIKIDELRKVFSLDESLLSSLREEFAIGSSALSERIDASVSLFWRDELLDRYPALKTFDSDEFVELVNRYKELTSDHMDEAQRLVSAKALGDVKNYSRQFPVALAAVEKEAKKKRKVKPLRQMFLDGHGDLLMNSKPCWLMNPLAISQFLPNIQGLFDVVIFDEASQVRVEEAIPSVYRAKKAVIVGDPKQMPPTNFFNAGTDDEDDDPDEPSLELEASILDLALLRFPNIMLSWHYRSRDEGLIAFSNRAFYSGSLIAAPNPKQITEKPLPYEFRKCEGYFNTKDGNKIEARAVAEEIRDYLFGDAKETLGVIAFGESQKKAIESALAEMRETDPELDRLYLEAFERKEDGSDVGLFVKNLENVQGDERDIIILSVGYAPAAKGKKLRKSFGPISISGGERRLNVAITRAKKKMRIFCSFDPSEIGSDSAAINKNKGTALFGKFLLYSKAVSEGSADLAVQLLDSLGIPGAANARKGINRFEADVKNVLEAEGYEVDAQIGSNGFFIDLGVRHPSIPHTYILGVECDGATFHSQPYVRERDKVRQQLLENRGWVIYRVWSQDWSKNRSSEILKLCNAVEQAKAKFEGMAFPKRFEDSKRIPVRSSEDGMSSIAPLSKKAQK